jgi:hypothetical protein|eukprot:COSAG06_NODE_205_length_20281_cov_6.904448_4_plen_124_part_00
MDAFRAELAAAKELSDRPNDDATPYATKYEARELLVRAAAVCPALLCCTRARIFAVSPQPHRQCGLRLKRGGGAESAARPAGRGAAGCRGGVTDPHTAAGARIELERASATPPGREASLPARC